MPFKSWFVNTDIQIGEWSCPGASEPLGVEEVLARHEIVIGRVGGHTRRIGRQRIVLDAAHVVRTSAGVPFRPAHAIGLPQRATYIQLSDTLFREVLGIDSGSGSRLASKVMCDRIPLAPAAAFAHMQLVRAVGVKASSLAIQGLGLEIASHVLGSPGATDAERNAATRNAREAVDAISQTLAFRYTEDLSLGDLASQVRLSPWHLSRIFRRLTGVSIWQHVMNLRLRSAIDRIAMGESDLGRLALALGFSSHSHFTASFRRAFGVPPSHPSVRAHLQSVRLADGRRHSRV